MSASKNAYVIDVEHPTETARLVEQSKLFTQAMGDLFPADLDLSGVRRVLDLGCGPGQWANEVAFEYPEWEVVGVDINSTMIEYSHACARSQGLPNISFEEMDLTQPFAFADASFELINARFIVGFQNKASWPALLAECRRVLAPGGLLLLTEAERSISTSPALQRLEGWLTRALYEQGRTFSVDGVLFSVIITCMRYSHRQWGRVPTSWSTRRYTTEEMMIVKFFKGVSRHDNIILRGSDESLFLDATASRLEPAGVGPGDRSLEQLGPEMAQAFRRLLDE